MMKRMLSSRKGVVIELAILMMAVCFAVVTIVLSTALLQHKNKAQAQQKMEESIILEQIAEAWLENTANESLEYEGYLCEIDPGKRLAVYKDDENKTKVLTVTVGADGIVTGWEKG